LRKSGRPTRRRENDSADDLRRQILGLRPARFFREVICQTLRLQRRIGDGQSATERFTKDAFREAICEEAPTAISLFRSG
jgi:hypothetical protein